MGIPKFFRWLGGRYPLVCERITDDCIPEFDNLYLDMNGIIHNCTHPKDGEAPAPTTDEERFLAIFYYIDFLFNKIRPQKMFFLGIDGVAPRAKMNEQRARRFRTAKELEEQHNKELHERRAKGEIIHPEQENELNSDVFDPTCITPGTEFMDKLTEALRYYINKRVSEDANWRKPEIILSAPNVPGEGEHKIMDYIRFTRAQPNYSPNVRHCLYGLDADLIMLGLLSHEPHFSLLREEVSFGSRSRNGASASNDPSMQTFYLLHISLLRDYLDHEFSSLKSDLGSSTVYESMEQGATAVAFNQAKDSDKFDLERMIDDYILMIMLVGNDFLPTLPNLSINGGALNFMFAAYMRIRPALGGYLHDNGVLDLNRFEIFMREISKFEVDSFKLEVQSHQWYQVYKHKAKLRGETPDELSVVQPNSKNRRDRCKGNRRRFGGGGSQLDDFMDDENIDYEALMGEASTPVKDNKLVISKSQKTMLDLIRRFAERALPKVVISGHKAQILFLPGPASPLDNLIVSRAAEMLELDVGHEYAHDGSMTLYVAAGSPKAIAKLEMEDSDSVGGGSSTPGLSSSAGGFAGSFAALGALEDDIDFDSDDEDSIHQIGKGDIAVPEFVKAVADPTDQAAVAEYVSECLEELDDVLVVPDDELDIYTRKGDSQDFWQRFELWKSGYYRSKLGITYETPTIGGGGGDGNDNDNNADSVSSTGQSFRAPPKTVEPMCRKYIETLQWVLMYYYKGCQSWSWYYPYHYAPCLSDICANLSSYAVEGFENDEPYTPYEQLMCVLPPFSRKLLPSPLRPLLVDVHSPIRDMYPTSFEVDMNGKKMIWEAVVLIDFVDIKRIREAMQSKLAMLSEPEQRRNGRGNNMAYSYIANSVEDEEDSDNVPQYTPPDSLHLPPIRPLRCKGIIYVMPSLKAKSSKQASLELISGLIPGSFTRAHLRPGFPSLYTLPHSVSLEFNGTEVFGSPTREESLMVEMAPNHLNEAGSAAIIAQELLKGKRFATNCRRPRRLFVSWPYLRDAVLVGVSDENGVYAMNAKGTDVIYREYGSGGERQIWIKKYMDAVNQAKHLRAVSLPKTTRVLLHVLHLRGLELSPNGSLMRDYGFPNSGSQVDVHQPWAPIINWDELGVQVYHPNLVCMDLSGTWVNNPRFAEHSAAPLEVAFPIRERVFFLGRTPLYGSPGKVVGHARDNAGNVVGVDLQLVANADFGVIKHENFLGVNVLFRQPRAHKEVYLPSFVVARDLGISPLILSRITSKMVLIDDSKPGRDGDGGRVFIGLNLKFEAKRMKVEGYTRRGPNGWQFSQRAIDLVRQYKDEFPHMFAGLEAMSKNKSSNPLASEFLASEGEDGSRHIANEVSRLRKWLKENVDRDSLVPVPIESDLLSKNQIDALIGAQKSFAASATNKKIIMRGVRREAALLPVDAQYVLRNQSLMVGHRVVYVADRSGSVPMGSKGYIVGIHAKKSNSAPSVVVPGSNNYRMDKMQQEGVPAEDISMVEIVLDKPFMDGITLEGRCPAQRGAMVRPNQILDLTSWGLGQNVTNRPVFTPRSVDSIKPAPDMAKSKHHNGPMMTSQAGHSQARSRAFINVSNANSSGGVDVPEPRQAPWAGHKPAPSKPTVDKDREHAFRIMSKLTGQSMPSSAKSKDNDADAQHAQNIINTLLSGPMGKLSVNSAKPSGTAMKNHPPVSGQQPIVVEEAYLSDSMDEDEEDEGKPAVVAAKVKAPSNNGKHFSGRGRGRGRGRGKGNRGRGGRGGRGGIGYSD